MKLKDSPFKIFLLILVVVLLLLPLQWVPALHICGYEVKRVALLSDVIDENAGETDSTKGTLPEVPAPPMPLSAENSHAAPDNTDKDEKATAPTPAPKGITPILDYATTEARGMAPFYSAIERRHSMKRPVRIAYFGDSFIEVDILTAALRDLLQQKYGGHGVGFLDMAPPYAANRSTVHQRYGGWTSHCVLDKGRYNRDMLNIGQRYFIPAGTGWTQISGTKQPRLDTTEVHTIYLRARTAAEIGVKLDDGPMLAMHAKGHGHAEALTRTGRAGKTRWQVPAASGLVCWGVAEESRQGVVVDNLSLRGSSGTTLAEIPMENLREMHSVRPYDLIVLQFGLNVASKDRTNYETYAKQMQKVVEHLKQSFPEAGILLVGVGDRENRMSDGQIHTLPGILALSRYQQKLAADCGIAFWNLFEAMGGEGSIRRMAEAQPAEAGKDYTHINARGGKRLANLLFKSLIYGQETYRNNSR